MKFLLHYLFWFSLLRILVWAGFLTIAEYPRTEKTKLGEDVVSLISAVGMAAWSGILLWR